MKIRKQTAGSGVVVNLLIIAMIAALYFSTSGNDAVNIAATDVFYSPPIYRGSSDDAAAIQFTVNYDAAALDAILDTLSQNNVQVTFAVSGQWANDNVSTLRRIAEDGHELATMGDAPEKDGNLSWVKSDISESLDAIERLCGVRPVLYYSGERRSIPISAHAAKQLGLTHVLCTVDLLAARGGSKDIVSRVKKVSADSSIILAQPTKAMSESLKDVLETLKSKGLSITTVSGIL